MMANAYLFEQQFRAATQKQVRVRINDNHSTMISVKWEPHVTKVSLHRIFLDAPEHVLEALTHHVRKKNSRVAPIVRAYIEEKTRQLDYSPIIRSKVTTQGKTYDLAAIYNAVNTEYFDGSLDLLITWYGRLHSRPRRSVTFGLYQPLLRLVKIHRMMDSPFFPDYFVEYVVYHEMLHHVAPSEYDAGGRHCVHTREFRRLERQHRHYDCAQEWLAAHYDTFFTTM